MMEAKEFKENPLFSGYEDNSYKSGVGEDRRINATNLQPVPKKNTFPFYFIE